VTMVQTQTKEIKGKVNVGFGGALKKVIKNTPLGQHGRRVEKNNKKNLKHQTNHPINWGIKKKTTRLVVGWKESPTVLFGWCGAGPQIQ